MTERKKSKKSKTAGERIQQSIARQVASAKKSRMLSERFKNVVAKHASGGYVKSIDSEAMLALIGAGLASFAPGARFVVDESGEPIEFTKKEVQRAGENLVTDFLLGMFKDVGPRPK
jgi:fructose-1,6-bisphosphatase/inositol monophosphatase family enzyme